LAGEISTLLPALRQDLSLHSGPNEFDGSPTWSLHDPAANRFYRLSWVAFEILSRWHLDDAQAVLDAVARETTLRADGEDLTSLLAFLSAHHLLDARGANDTARLARAAQASRPSRLGWLLKNYLFFRVPLFRPSALLDRCAPYVRWAFDARFWLAIACTALFGLYLASREWERFVHTFSAYDGMAEFLGIGLALSFAKILHELGHAFTAHRFGCRVPTMGVAFLVMLPVLYTDTNEAWKLHNKRDRLAIAAAGMLAELALAAVATVAWSFLPDSPLRAGVFLLATTTWIITLGINASPFMRFDGYFLLSDLLDMPNLHSRAFALGRWWMRRTLFGWDEEPPEVFPAGRRRFLVAFAFATWAYRLVVFLGIAFLVYHVSFKLLGLVLLAIELGWFILWPMGSELAVWWKARASMQWNRATKRSALSLAAIAAVLFVPWRSDVRAPAVLGAFAAQGLYAVSAAQVASDPLAVGTQVEAGQVLVRLESPELRFHLAQEQAREQLLHWEVQQQPFNDDLKKQGPALREAWMEASAAVKSWQEQNDQLVVRAPFAGRIAQIDEGLVKGAWVANKEKLFEVVGPKGAKAEAFVGEHDLAGLQPGSAASFVAGDLHEPAYACQIESVDRVNIAALESLYLASTFGGAILVQKDSKHGALVPTEAWYRVRLEDCRDARGLAPLRELRGTAHLKGPWSSIAGGYVRRGIAVVQREMGF